MSRAEERAAEISHLFVILHQWGIHTLGQLAALPQDKLAARLGPLGARLWEQANGKSSRLLRLVRPAEIFAEQIEFEHEIETAEPLLFVLRRFLEQLTQRLRACYFLARELTLRLSFADKTSYQHRFQIPDPTNSVELLFRLLQTHLENFRAEHPIVAAALEAQPARPGKQQFRFFETPLRDPARLHETLNRLTGWLGQERVGRPVLEDSHRDDAFHLEPFLWEANASPNESPCHIQTLLGPVLRRLRATTGLVAGDGVPGRAESREKIAIASSTSKMEAKEKVAVVKTSQARPASAGDTVPGYNGSPSAVVARQGPYLSSGEWWDNNRWERVAWDLELEDGTLCRAQERGGSWQVEGIYD